MVTFILQIRIVGSTGLTSEQEIPQNVSSRLKLISRTVIICFCFCPPSRFVSLSYFFFSLILVSGTRNTTKASFSFSELGRIVSLCSLFLCDLAHLVNCRHFNTLSIQRNQTNSARYRPGDRRWIYFQFFFLIFVASISRPTSWCCGWQKQKNKKNVTKSMLRAKGGLGFPPTLNCRIQRSKLNSKLNCLRAGAKKISTLFLYARSYRFFLSNKTCQIIQNAVNLP